MSPDPEGGDINMNKMDSANIVAVHVTNLEGSGLFSG